MTVRDWMAGLRPQPPAALQHQIVVALGSDAGADASQTTTVCLDAAARSLEGLIAAKRFDRNSAIDLLTIDALTTYAFEYASACGGHDIEATAAHATRMFGQLISHRA